jgi:hypothetical protein
MHIICRQKQAWRVYPWSPTPIDDPIKTVPNPYSEPTHKPYKGMFRRYLQNSHGSVSHLGLKMSSLVP